MVNDVPMDMAFHDILGEVQKGCLLLIPLFLIIRTAFAIVKGFLDPMLKVAYQPLYHGLLVWVAVATYPDIMHYFDALCQTIIGFISKPLEDPSLAISKAIYTRTAISNLNTQNRWNEAVKEIISGDLLKGTGNMVGTASEAFVKSITQTGEDWIAGLISIFATIARMFIETVRSIFLRFLIVVGPLAISLSLAEGFNHLARYWLQKITSVYLWALTLNLLDRIVISYYTNASALPEAARLVGVNMANQTPYFMDQLIVGGMYLMVPWLTSSYLGGTNAGHFLANKLSYATSLVTSVLSTSRSIVTNKSSS